MDGLAPTMNRFLAALLVLAAAYAPVQAAEIKALRIWSGPEYTRAVFDVSGPLDYKLFDLNGPDRLVLDLKSSTFAADYEATGAKGLLKSVRSGKQGAKAGNPSDSSAVCVIHCRIPPIRSKQFASKPWLAVGIAFDGDVVVLAAETDVPEAYRFP